MAVAKESAAKAATAAAASTGHIRSLGAAGVTSSRARAMASGSRDVSDMASRIARVGPPANAAAWRIARHSLDEGA